MNDYQTIKKDIVLLLKMVSHLKTDVDELKKRFETIENRQNSLPIMMGSIPLLNDVNQYNVIDIMENGRNLEK